MGVKQNQHFSGSQIPQWGSCHDQDDDDDDDIFDKSKMTRKRAVQRNANLMMGEAPPRGGNNYISLQKVRRMLVITSKHLKGSVSVCQLIHQLSHPHTLQCLERHQNSRDKNWRSDLGNWPLKQRKQEALMRNRQLNGHFSDAVTLSTHEAGRR